MRALELRELKFFVKKDLEGECISISWMSLKMIYTFVISFWLDWSYFKEKVTVLKENFRI